MAVDDRSVLLARVAELEAERDALERKLRDAWKANVAELAEEYGARVRVQAEQIAALQEALKRIARRGPDQPPWSRALYAQCQVIAREALACAEGCAAPADEEGKPC